MKTFRHHPDGLIYINDFYCSLKDFVKIEKGYKLTEGYIGREYRQGEFHRLFTENSETFLDKKWVEGDTYLDKLDHYKKEIAKIEKAKELEERKTQESLAKPRKIN